MCKHVYVLYGITLKLIQDCILGEITINILFYDSLNKSNEEAVDIIRLTPPTI